mgnify:FL=1
MAASNSGVQLLEPKLKLQISAPLASAYFMASMTLSGEPLPSEPPKAFNTISLTWVLFVMPAMPPLFQAAAIVPAPWVPWLSSSPVQISLLFETKFQPFTSST